MEEPAVPSQVSDRDFLYMPPEEEVCADEEWVYCGKWILHLTEFGMEMLDRTWLLLQPLLFDGTLIMLKASTGLKGLEHAHIQCFTSTGKERAKRAANCIRKVLQENGVDFLGIMYYKLNELTKQGRARRKGHKNHTTYMHTFLGWFYVRDPQNIWKLLDDEDENKTRIPKFCSATSSGSHDMPAKHFQVLQREGSDKLEANWYVYCSSVKEDDHYIAPADRVWMVAGDLYDQALFDKISRSKRDEQVEIRFYVSKEYDVQSQLSIIDRIFNEASFHGILYFNNNRGVSDNNKYSYKYTSKKELYEQRQFGEIYVPNLQG